MYHITTTYHGRHWIVYPRRLPDFPNKRGISVSPTILQAVFGAIGLQPKRKIYVYKADMTNVKIFVPSKIYDQKITGERIITSKCRFRLIRTIKEKYDIEAVNNLHYTLGNYHNERLRNCLFEIWSDGVLQPCIFSEGIGLTEKMDLV